MLAKLERLELITRLKGHRGAWKLSPNGRARVAELASDMDIAALSAEASQASVTELAATPHPVIPPSLAPPALAGPLRAFLDRFPFERNVFGMTRFPGTNPGGKDDPIEPALKRASEICEKHGLTFHLASDRSIVDDLWANVAAHMWGCRFGVAFFESRTEKGLNYNLNIEVGSCLVLGRRMALLKDHSLAAMPTDLVGQIYFDVNLDDPDTVGDALDGWIGNSLAL
ncbi:MAG: hypothetical protein ITG02_13645 [Patulibacter sp.]|nr:hypothetical protein [Patulibacter sp.]